MALLSAPCQSLSVSPSRLLSSSSELSSISLSNAFSISPSCRSTLPSVSPSCCTRRSFSLKNLHPFLSTLHFLRSSWNLKSLSLSLSFNHSHVALDSASSAWQIWRLVRSISSNSFARRAFLASSCRICATRLNPRTIPDSLDDWSIVLCCRLAQLDNSGSCFLPYTCQSIDIPS